MLFLDSGFFLYDDEEYLVGSDLTIDMLKELSKYGEVSVKCYNETNDLYAYISSIRTKDVIDIKGIIRNYSLLKSKPESVISICAKQGIEVDDVTVDELLNTIGAVQDRTRSGKIRDDLSPYIKGSPDAISAFRQQRVNTGIDYGSPNETCKQTKETDRLFIAFPPQSLMKPSQADEFDDEFDYQVESMGNICTPYPSVLYSIYGIARLFRSPATRREEVMNDLIAMANEFGGGIDKSRATKIKSSFSLIPEDHIFGSSVNDTLDIQENELDYYNALKKFISYQIGLYNTMIYPDKTAEQIEEQNKEDYRTATIPIRAKKYLLDLIEEILRTLYSHTGRFKGFSYTEDEDGSDYEGQGNDSKGGSESGEELSVGYMSDHRGSDPHIDVLGYLTIVGEQFGADVWAEAIVKLSRWGDRRPKVLVVGNNNPNVLSLSTFSIETGVYNLLDTEKIQEADGRTVVVKAYVVSSFEQDYVQQEMPSGLIVVEQIKHPNNEDSVITLPYLISVHDVVKEYRNGNPIISGINLDDGVFYVDSEYESLPQLSFEDTKNYTQFPHLNTFTDFCLENGISSGKDLAHSLSESLVLQHLLPDVTNYKEYISEQIETMRSQALSVSLLEVFNKTAIDYMFDELSSFLTCYNDSVYNEFEHVFSNGVEDNETVPTLALSSVFNNIEETNKYKGMECVDMFIVYDGDISSINFEKILLRKESSATNSKDPNRVVGYLGKTDKGNFILAGPNNTSIRNVNPETARTLASIVGLVICASAAKELIERDGDKAVTVYIASKDTMLDMSPF